MIIWSGWGILVAVVGFLCLLLTNVAVNGATQDPKYYESHGWPKLLGFCIAAAISGPMGWAMNRNGAGHSLFFIPVQYWWGVFLVLGIIFLFV